MYRLVPGIAMLAGCGAVGIQVASTATGQGEGAAASAFALPSQLGTTVALDDVLARGPALLVFYRGFW